MSKVCSVYWDDAGKFKRHPIFAFERDGLIYIWRYDLEREAMLNQCTGVPATGKPTEDHILAYINRTHPQSTDLHHKEVTIRPSTFHPRIYKPGAIEDNFRERGCPISDPKAMGQCLVATNILLAKLKTILEVIELADQNLDTYGHEIRNLLLLSCMEAESVLSAILRENKYPAGKWGTKDYAKLCDPLHLDKYKVKFNLYPDFDELAPFKGWDTKLPTQSLSWYDAYNKTKHDREQNISHATLQQTVLSISAVAVLLYVQFGPHHEFWKQGELLNISVSTSHEYSVDDYYIPHSTDKTLRCTWEATPLPL